MDDVDDKLAGFRVEFEYYRGFSRLWQFFLDKEENLSFGFWFHFRERGRIPYEAQDSSQSPSERGD